MAEQQTQAQAGSSESTDDTTQVPTQSEGAHSAAAEGSGAAEANGSGGTGTAEDQAGQEQPGQDRAAQDQPAQRSPSHPRPQQPSSEDDQAQQAQQGDTRTRGGAEEAPTEKHEVPQGRKTRTPIDVREVAWKVASVLATVVRLAGFVFALVLVAFILLTLIGVNPLNGVAQFIGGFAGTVVGPFRDLFLIADPITSVVVNFGIAAIVWALVGEFLARLIRFVGARLG